MLIVANDATVKGGTYYPITVKKHLRAQEIAWRTGLPCIYLVDSGGAFLPLQAEVFPIATTSAASSITRRACPPRASRRLAAVMGSCTAGGAYVPAMSDETVIVRGNGTIFLGGPPLVKAATGEEVTAEELGGADVHTRISGVADHYAENDEHALAICCARSWRTWNRRKPIALAQRGRRKPPRYDPPRSMASCRATRAQPIDVREVIARLVDGSRLHEFKARYGTTLVCGFAHLHGLSGRHPRQQRHPLLG